MSVDQPSAPNQPEVLQRHRALDVRPEAQGATTRVVAIALTGLLLGPACSSTLPTPEAGAAAAVQREHGVGAVALAAAKARKAARKATTTRKCRTVKVNGRTRTRC